MSQFNQGPGGGTPYKPQGGGYPPQGGGYPPPGGGYQPGGYQQPGFNPPPNKSGGNNTVIIVVSIIGGLLLLGLIFCGFVFWTVNNTINNMANEFGNMIVDSMANDTVSKYQDNPTVLEKIGTIEDYEFVDVEGFDLLTKPVARLNVSGDKGSGQIVLYRKSGKLERVVLEVDGQEIVIDDKPEEIFSDEYQEEFDGEMGNPDEPSDENGMENPADNNSQDSRQEAGAGF